MTWQIAWNILAVWLLCNALVVFALMPVTPIKRAPIKRRVKR